MPAKSKQQQKFMGMVHALNKGDMKPSDASQSVKDVAKTIKKSDAKDFASTKHSGLPKRVKEQILKAFKEYASKMGTNTLGGDDYTTSRKGGLRDFDGYDNVDYNKDMPMDESVNEGYGDWVKAKNLTDIIKLSKQKKNATFYVTDDNNSRIGSFYLKNGKFAKATTANPNYDLKRNKTKLKDRSDVIYKYKVDESVNEGMFSTLDQIRKDSKDVRDFIKNVFKDKDFMKMKTDKEFIKYLQSIYESVDESKGVPQNYMQGRTSDYHTALRGRNRDYSGGTNFKKTNHGQPDLENNEEDQETNSLSVKQTPVKEAISGMSNKTIEDEMKRHGIKKIPIDSHGERLLKGLQKEKFINKVDNLYKLTYFYATIPKGKRYQYGSAKKPLSPLVDYFQNELMGQNIILTSKMAAYRVAQNIIDMYNNDEEIESPYYLLKNYFNSFGMDTNRSRTFKGAQYHLEQWLKRNKKYEKAMIKEAKLDHHRIVGNSIELLVRHNRVKYAIRFKDKRILDKMGFDWSKPKNIEKLLSLKKLPKGMSISRSFHEYGQRLDLSFIEDEEAKLDGTPKPKDAIDRDIDENVKVGQMIQYDDKFLGKGTAKVKYIIPAKPNKAGVTHHYITNKGTFSNQSLIGSDDYKKRYSEGSIKQMTAQILRMKKGEMKPYELPSKTQKFYYKNKKKFDSLKEYSGGSYEYTKGDQYGQNSVNEIGVFPITSYMKGIIPADFVNTTTRDKKERLRSTLRDLKNTLNHFWKQHKIPYRIK